MKKIEKYHQFYQKLTKNFGEIDMRLLKTEQNIFDLNFHPHKNFYLVIGALLSEKISKHHVLC